MKIKTLSAITNPPVWKNCGHQRTPENISKRYIDHPNGRCIICHKKYMAEYNRSVIGKEKKKRYFETLKGQEVVRKSQKKYRESEHGKIMSKAYDRSRIRISGEVFHI